MFIGPLFGGYIASWLGFSAVFIITGGMMLANVVWVLVGIKPADPERGWR